MKQSLFSLQGYFRVGERLPNGKPGPLHWVGNVEEGTFEMAMESTTKTESFTGNRMSYGKLNTSKSATLNMTLDEWSVRNLAMGLYSSVVGTVGGTVTAEEFPAGLLVGDQVRLDHPYASSLVITDSTTGTPVVVDPADYTLTGHNQRTVEILDLTGPYVQPLKAAYTYAGYDSLEAFSDSAKDRYVIVDAVNTENGDTVELEFYRVNFDPFSSISLINSEYGNLPMTGAVLFDPLNMDANGKGGFFRINQRSETP